MSHPAAADLLVHGASIAAGNPSYDDPDAPAASAAAAGVAALDLGNDNDVDLSGLPSSDAASALLAAAPELDLELELELKRLAQARRRSPSPSSARKGNKAGSAGAAAAKKVDLTSAEAFPTLGGGGAAAANKPKSLFSAYSNVASIASSTTSRAAPAAARKAVEHSSTVTVEMADFVPTMTPTASGPTDALRSEVKFIESRTQTKLAMSKRAGTGMVVFTARGPTVESVELAKRMLVARVTPKMTATISIPSNMRARIVGQGGKTIQGISQRTQVSIDMERNTAKPASAKQAKSDESADAEAEVEKPEDEESEQEEQEQEDGVILDDESADPTTTVKLTGDAQGLELAKAEILAIVGHHVAIKRAQLSTRTVPTTLYPFLIGANGSKVAELEATYDVKIAIPPPAYLQAERATPSRHAELIVIKGEEANVLQAVAAIKSIAEDLIDNIGELAMSVDKRKHKFILGGASVQELLASTGCIVELPPASDASNQVLVRGPNAQLPAALQIVMAKATSVQAADFDLSPYVAGAKSTNTAAVYAQYLNANDRKSVKAIEAETGAQVFFPRGADAGVKHVLEVAGPSKQSVEACKNQLAAYLKEKGTFFYNIVPVAQEMLKHSKVKGALAKAREELAAAGSPKPLVLDTVYLSNAEFADELTLVVFDPNHGPTSAKKGHTNSPAPAIKAKVAEDVLKAAHLAADFTTDRISIPAKYHRYFVGSKGVKLNAILAEFSKTPEVPLIIRLGTGPNKANTSDKVPVALEADEVLVRGIKSEVQAVIAHLKKIGEQAKHAEIMCNFEAEFMIPAKFAPQLVGRGGANLAPFREQIGINKLDIGQNAEGSDSVKVSLRGTQEAVAHVKAALEKKVAELADFTNSVVKVPNEYHGKIIGEKGKYVKRLEEKYAVRIDFPRSGSNEDQNAIAVRGGRKGVKEAVAEIVELYEYEKANNYSETLSIPAFVVSTLVGKGGARITQLKQLTGAKIDLPPNRARGAGTPASGEDVDVDETETVTLVGTKDEVVLAKQVIKELVVAMGISGMTWPSTKLEVPRALHRRLIGPGGSVLKELLAPFNKAAAAAHKSSKKPAAAPTSASAEVKALVRTIYALDSDRSASSEHVDVKFPKSAGDEIIIKAETTDLVEKVKKALEAKVAELQAETTTLLYLPTSVFPPLIGAGGSGVRELQSAHKVSIDFNQSHREIEGADVYPIPEDREDLTAAEKKGTIVIRGQPEAVEACIAAMMAKVPYTKQIVIPASHKRAFLIEGAAELRKIRSAGVQLTTPPKNKVSDKDDETWTIRGDKDKVDKVLADIQVILDAAPVAGREQQGHGASRGPEVVKEIDDIEQQHHKYIIGRRGQTISEIRAATSTRIDVPRAGEGHTIVIRGSKQEDVDEAESMIREAVERGANRD
ncbi:hypothetical protein BCR44DRAFT_53717 [Catenaria anguillulae PL171]|uniref:K Homology domain-containing protein n=1 Tax=Catenaria anguillulae PL171 TaxID=765915 RepID=A0A1Y2HPK0_9FUNG|nr:hypothetical protein BCR44DRAFT_53717 [Catenaria anguillulae PL171]